MRHKPNKESNTEILLSANLRAQTTVSRNPNSPRPGRAGWIKGLVAAVIAVAMAGSMNLATASALSDTTPRVNPVVESYASEFSVPLQEAERRLDRIQPLQDTLAEIRELESARLAGWGIDHAGTFTGWVWLTGDQPPSPEGVSIADAHTDIEIRTGAAHSYATLLKAQQGLSQLGHPGTIDDSTDHDVWSMVTFTDINLRANRIEIGIDPQLDISTPAAIGPSIADETFHAKAAELTGLLRGHVPVRFAVVDGRGIAPTKDFGGGEQIGLCTAGFAARRTASGRYGIITAGHCGDPGPNENQTLTMHGITLPFVSGWASVTADAQFHFIPTGSSHVLLDDYICDHDNDSWCDVTGSKARQDMVRRYNDRIIGDHVCHTGRKSGDSCGTIDSINYQPTYSNACIDTSGNEIDCYNVFVKVKGTTLESCKGDSGGPWYNSSGVAYGIHMGSKPADNCVVPVEYAFFSAIREVESFLGVEILTEGSVTVN